MRKSTRNIFLLAAVVVALGVGIRLEVTREEKMLPMPLTFIDPAAVKSLEIRCAECRTRRFERRASGWWMLEPYPLRADDSAVSRLVAVAKAPVRKKLDAKRIRFKKTRSRSSTRYDDHQ